MNFSMNQTWSQAIALVRENFQILAIVAGVFLLLPSLLMYVALPDMMSMITMADDPEAITNMMQGMIGSLLTYGLIALLAQIVGYVAMVALMSHDRPTVGEAILGGLKAIPTLFGAFILFMVLAFVASLVFTLLMTAVAVVLGETLGAILAVIMVIGLLLGMLYVMTRLCLTVPIIVLEGELNPIKDFTRSWKLTAPHSMAIFGFFVLLYFAYIVVSMLLLSILSLIIGGSVFLLGIANGVVGAAIAMVMCGVLVSMYRQLSGNDGPHVSETFE